MLQLTPEAAEAHVVLSSICCCFSYLPLAPFPFFLKKFIISLNQLLFPDSKFELQSALLSSKGGQVSCTCPLKPCPSHPTSPFSQLCTFWGRAPLMLLVVVYNSRFHCAPAECLEGKSSANTGQHPYLQLSPRPWSSHHPQVGWPSTAWCLGRELSVCAPGWMEC